MKIIHDTGATQPIMVSHVLLLYEQMSVDASVLIQEVGIDILRVLLYQIHLQFDLISGPVVVGIKPSLQVNGVSVILGNDLAGGKVQPHLQAVSDTELVLCSPSAVDGPYATFPVCVMTRAAERHTLAPENDTPTGLSVLLTDQE